MFTRIVYISHISKHDQLSNISWENALTSNKNLFGSTGSRKDAEMIGVKLYADLFT